MDQETKQLFNRPAFELFYGDGRTLSRSHDMLVDMIEEAHSKGKITRWERNKLIQINDEIYNDLMRG